MQAAALVIEATGNSERDLFLRVKHGEPRLADVLPPGEYLRYGTIRFVIHFGSRSGANHGRKAEDVIIEPARSNQGPGRPRDPRVDVAITEAAISVIRERGWAFTIEEVAQRATVSKNSIYRRYPTKAAITLAAWIGDRDLRFPSTDTGSIWGDLTAFVMGTIRMSGQIWGMILPALLAESKTDPTVADALAQVWSWRLATIGEIVQRGIERGEIPPQTDPHHVGELVDGPLMLRIAVTLDPMDPVFADRLVEDVMSVLGRT
jgi:AcrR family transcriptional regulator